MKTGNIALLCTVLMASSLNVSAQRTHALTFTACDRACLSGLLDKYMEALLTHDPGILPLSNKVRFTENNVPLAVGDGLWNTIDDVGDYRLPVLDEEEQQAGLYGVVEENGKQAHFSLRIRVVDSRITEIETIVLRANYNNGFAGPENMKPRAAFYEDIPKDKQLTRKQLVTIANSYFETLQQNHGAVLAPFAPTCHRIESGISTTNSNAPGPSGSSDGIGILKMGCEDQFKTGFFRFVTHIRDRRFPVVDRQKGLVFTAGFFDHRGDMRKVKLTSGQVVDALYDTPWTWHIAELFKIDKEGRIDQVEAFVMQAPYGIQDIWTERPRWEPAH